MEKPKRPKPGLGKRLTRPEAGGRRTSRTAERYVRRSAKTGRIAGSTRRRPDHSTSPGEEENQLARGGFGCAEGLIWIAPDFDEPLEEFEADS